MFAVSDEEAAAIQRALTESGEWAAVAELRRYFAVRSNTAAIQAVRTIAGWKTGLRGGSPLNQPGDPAAPVTTG